MPIEGVGGVRRRGGGVSCRYAAGCSGWETYGGNVLTVCAHASSMEKAASVAYDVVGKIHFDGMQYRRDIAEVEIMDVLVLMGSSSDFSVMQACRAVL